MNNRFEDALIDARDYMLTRLVIAAILAIILIPAYILRNPAPPQWEGVSYIDVEITLPPTIDVFITEGKPRRRGRTYTGTAFATLADSVWVTARHVVEGCASVHLNRSGKIIHLAKIAHARATDLSLLYAKTGGGIAPAQTDILPMRDTGIEGFGMGYPGGRPKVVHFGYLGRFALRERDRKRRRFRWATAGMWQIRKTGLFDEPDLSGLSGGPLLDENGGLLGVLVAGQPRRARAVTLDPVNLSALLDAAGGSNDRRGWRHRGITTKNANATRGRLVVKTMLAKVICTT